MTAKRPKPKAPQPRVTSKIVEHIEGSLNLTREDIVNLVREKFAIPEAATWEGFDDPDVCWTFSGLAISWKFDREVDPEEMGCHGDC